MALITCPECRNKISETAKSCPKCGFALTPERAHEIKRTERTNAKAVLATVLVMIALSCDGSCYGDPGVCWSR